jgi:hypothetical protein
MTGKSKDNREASAQRDGQRRNRDHGDLDPSETRPSPHSGEGEVPTESPEKHDPHRRDDEPLH